MCDSQTHTRTHIQLEEKNYFLVDFVGFLCAVFDNEVKLLAFLLKTGNGVYGTDDKKSV